MNNYKLKIKCDCGTFDITYGNIEDKIDLPPCKICGKKHIILSEEKI